MTGSVREITGRSATGGADSSGAPHPTARPAGGPGRVEPLNGKPRPSWAQRPGPPPLYRNCRQLPAPGTKGCRTPTRASSRLPPPHPSSCVSSSGDREAPAGGDLSQVSTQPLQTCGQGARTPRVPLKRGRAPGPGGGSATEDRHPGAWFFLHPPPGHVGGLANVRTSEKHHVAALSMSQVLRGTYWHRNVTRGFSEEGTCSWAPRAGGRPRRRGQDAARERIRRQPPGHGSRRVVSRQMTLLLMGGHKVSSHLAPHHKAPAASLHLVTWASCHLASSKERGRVHDNSTTPGEGDRIRVPSGTGRRHDCPISLPVTAVDLSLRPVCGLRHPWGPRSPHSAACSREDPCPVCRWARPSTHVQRVLVERGYRQKHLVLS